MNYFYVNKTAQSTGENEVHINNCAQLPDANNREYLGYFSDCQDAIIKAQQKYEIVDGCKFCIPDCHSE
ncbi:MAG: hypothetical protein PF484_01345 [Bacteroidales bacterium]|jgi:hypothetical protein|nr:hypothetical protein [Bacteroidales bacterium]